jgi:O-antigen/teichoic acid export membrane protein
VLTARGDILLLSLTGRNATIGIYAVAVTAASPMAALTAAVSTQTFSERARGGSRLPGLKRILVGSMIVVALGVFGLEALLTTILGSAYEKSVLPAQILLVASPAASLRVHITARLRGGGAVRRATVIEAIAFVATVLPLVAVVGDAQPLTVALISFGGYIAGAGAAVIIDRKMR